MDNIRFIREQDECSLILDTHWRAEIENIAETRPTLKRFFEDPTHSTIELYLAGKDNGPDAICLETVSEALLDLEDTLAKLHTDHAPRDPNWHFSAITVPYQFVRLYYLTYWSEYGVDIHYGIKIEDCKYGIQGIYPEDETVTISSIPGTISCIVRALTAAGIDDEDFFAVRREIECQKVFGHELQSQLRVLLQKHNHKWHNGSQHLQSLLEIERFIEKGPR